MIKIVTRAMSPTLDPNSFAAKPKTLYRAGTKYARIEEAPDPENGIHGLIVINEPDSWLVNLAHKTGQHIVDPGPTFIVHSPVFWSAKREGEDDPDKYFKDFEFGRELEFFREHNAEKVENREVEGKQCRALRVKNGSREVILLLEPTIGTPWQIDIGKDGKLESSVRYLDYKTGLPFEKSLFEPPNGIKISDAGANRSGSVAAFGWYQKLAAWAREDNENSRQFSDDLRKSRSAKDVAAALKESARRQRKTTDRLAQLIHDHPELRDVPQLGLDREGLQIWERNHPDVTHRQTSVPPEVIAISEQMHRFNSELGASGGREAVAMLHKYHDDPEVRSAADELGAAMAENRKKLLDALR
jgi:hypothetical protein